MDIRKYGPYCLVGQAGFPPGSVPVPSFTAPLVILKQADPLWNRCLYPFILWRRWNRNLPWRFCRP